MLTLLARTTRGDAREALRAAGRAQKAGRAVGTREACMLEGLQYRDKGLDAAENVKLGSFVSL